MNFIKKHAQPYIFTYTKKQVKRKQSNACNFKHGRLMKNGKHKFFNNIQKMVSMLCYRSGDVGKEHGL